MQEPDLVLEITMMGAVQVRYTMKELDVDMPEDKVATMINGLVLSACEVLRLIKAGKE